MQNQKVLILDFGGQYNQLIARRVRECNVYCEVKPFDMSLEEIRAYNPLSIIFTGGPNSVYAENSPHPDPGVYSLGVPILGICYGCQLLSHELGGLVTDEALRTYGELYPEDYMDYVDDIDYGEYVEKYGIEAVEDAGPASVGVIGGADGPTTVVVAGVTA